MLVGVLFGDGNTQVTRRRSIRRRSGPLHVSPRFRYGGRGVTLSGDEHLAGIGSFTKRMVRKTTNLAKKVVTAPFDAGSKVVRTATGAASTLVRRPTHGILNVGRNIGGSVTGTVRSVVKDVAPAAANIAGAYLASQGINPPGASSPPFVDPRMFEQQPIQTADQVVEKNKLNTALMYGGAGVGALLIGGAIILLMKRK